QSSSSIPGWTFGGGGSDSAEVLNPTTASFGAEAPEGQNLAHVVLVGGMENAAQLTQTLDATYQANTTYVLKVLVLNSFGTPHLYANGSLLDVTTQMQAGSPFSEVTITHHVGSAASEIGQPIV